MERIDKPNSSLKTSKFFMILLMLLILLIPIGFLFNIVNGRETYRNEAVANVSKSWAAEQTIMEPRLKINDKAMPIEKYNADIVINTEIRKKGIFKVPVYTADIKVYGLFKNNSGNLKDAKAVLDFDVSDTKGFVEAPQFKLGINSPKTLGDKLYTTKITTNSPSLPFEITYKLRGVNSFYILPAGNINKFKISGNWSNPSFDGEFLPSERKVSGENFSAKWSIPKIAIPVSSESVNSPKAGVSLLTPVDNYRMAQRAVKYAFLFLVLTFIAYFVFEITSKENKQIHPLQYVMIGIAMLVFYLLLTSTSEFMPFGVAYMLSTIMTVGLIGLYTNFVLVKNNNKAFTILMMGILSALYLFLYTLLIIQDLSLIIGSFLLFIIIAIIMYATRNVEWYE